MKSIQEEKQSNKDKIKKLEADKKTIEMELLIKKIDDLDKKRLKDYLENGNKEKLEKTLGLGGGAKNISLA